MIEQVLHKNHPDFLYTCSKCRVQKPNKEFSPRNPKDGKRQRWYQAACKACYNSLVKRTQDPIRRQKYALKHRYGITKEEYIELEAFQDYQCAICGARANPDNTKLCVDHCHNGLGVRGLLCKPCNLGLGNFRDDEQLLINAVSYLKNTPASKMKSKLN